MIPGNSSEFIGTAVNLYISVNLYKQQWIYIYHTYR